MQRASNSLAVLAADEAQWVQGWLGALEAAGLLRAADKAPPIRADELVVSLNATLATGILLAKAGQNYRTQADILAFFTQVQKWYGDTARYAGDALAAHAPVDYVESRKLSDGGEVYIPVPVAPNPADYDQNAAQDTHFISFDVFAGGQAELEYLRHIGVLDADFSPVGPQALNLTQYLQQAAASAADGAAISVRGPQALPGANGASYVPTDYALPYTVNFSNPSSSPVGEIRLVTQLDEDLDARSLRLADLKIGDINIHLPSGQAVFQGDFDFTGTVGKGFVLRVSAGIDAENRIATWLIQAIDPDTGEVLRDPQRGLMLPDSRGKAASGFVAYSVRASDVAASGASLSASARVLFDAAPPIQSATISSTLDAVAPKTTLTVTSNGDATGIPKYSVSWKAADDASGTKHVTVYVSEDGGDFRIWQRQVLGAESSAVFTGVAGQRYEFLAVATDYAGNREAASVVNAVLPDDGSRDQAQQNLGSTETLDGSRELPAATPDRSYPTSELFAQSLLRLPGFVVPGQTADLQSVLAPLQLRGFASGFAASEGDIGALAMVELLDGSVLASAGAQRNEVFRFAKEGGRSTTPLFTLDSAVLDMALDALGQLWVMTGAQLLQIDATSGAIIGRHSAAGGDPLTHALAIQPGTGLIYVSSGNGVEIFDPKAANENAAWTHFSNTRVGDLAFGPDGRLWGVRWTGSAVNSALPEATTDIISFPMSGRTVGRAEVEYRLNGLVDSLAFGRAGTGLAGLLLASSNTAQRPVNGDPALAHTAAVWMIELQSRRTLQLASGGTRGESIVATADGRILVAQSSRIDELAPVKAPKVIASTLADGAFVPLPLTQVAVSFDQPMWTGSSGADATDAASVLNPLNYSLIATGANSYLVLTPQSVRWDAGARAAVLTLPNLPAGTWRLEVGTAIRSAAQVRLGDSYVINFTAVTDISNLVRLEFADTRANRLTGAVSYDLSITNIGTDDLRGPLMLLLDPGRYFGDSVVGGVQGTGEQAALWVIDLNAALQAVGGRLASGQTLANQTVSVRPASTFAGVGAGTLAKFDLGHGVYAVPYDNTPPTVAIVGAAPDAPNALPAATAGTAWTAGLQATDADGRLFYWELVKAPKGLSLEQDALVESSATGFGNRATLRWTPTATDRADNVILLRVIDSRGGVALRRYTLDVAGANHLPVIDALNNLLMAEGDSLTLPLLAADEDGDALTLLVRNLPAGARFDAANGLLTWTPGFDQAGDYNDITVVVSDGKHEVQQRFNIRVTQGFPRPVFPTLNTQVLREGERFGMQLPGSIPGGLLQADGSTVQLKWTTPVLPAGATLDEDTGWFSWSPGYAQAGMASVNITLMAIFTPADGGTPTITAVGRVLTLDVRNANGAPVFDPVETWQVLEGQALRISVFAFDPDNPSFEPKIRLTAGGEASGPDTTPASVSYTVTGLPPGASFDADTLEILWTPGYAQAGTYYVSVKATDTGDGTGTPLSSEITLPIIVSNANRAPTVGTLVNAFVDRGAVLEIPVSAVDADGNPLTLTVQGLPAFATYTQVQSVNGQISGVIRFAPGAGQRGDYTVTVTVQDNGDGDVNQVAAGSQSFVLTVRSPSEAPVISLPAQVVAVAGQTLRVPILVSDMDQDALSFAAQGLPAGATIELDPRYGRATLVWTPGAALSGSFDVSLAVTDSGLPPADAGYVIDPAHPPVPNTTVRDLRIVVRAANAAPALIGVAATGGLVTGDGLTGARSIITVDEGVPLSIELSALDSDLDLLDWTVEGLPSGMTLQASNGSGGQGRALLRWTTGLFAAQSDNQNGIAPGHYLLTARAGDGSAAVSREIEIVVRNVNQAPRLLALPLQLVPEGQTLNFSMLASDGDNDATRLALLYDETTPAGVFFDAASGAFEWTPGFDVVNNANGQLTTAYNFTFSASDGQDTVYRTVQVRVFDVNRNPAIVSASHALLVGQSFVLPVVKAASAAAGALRVWDADGAVQTAALSVSFSNLPEGARYDAIAGQLLWSPGPGQVGDFVVLASVSDGRNSVTESFTLRVVADPEANAPGILINLTPSTPVLPGQAVVATVRATAFSPIASIAVQMRVVGSSDWLPVALDGLGRLRITPAVPGLIEIRVVATDVDGFSATRTETLRVRDPLDLAAPVLNWVGSLGTEQVGAAPAVISGPTALQAQVNELQLMGWVLEAAPSTGGTVDESAWTTVAQRTLSAVASTGLVDLASLDPALWANGVYTLRLRAYDLVGRTTEISTRVLVDSAIKRLTQASSTDTSFLLGNHSLALTRSLGTQPDASADMGNWNLPLLDTHLSHDQATAGAIGAAQAWREGARVWLQMPANLADANAAMQYLSFSLGTTAETLGSDPAAPSVLRPVFSSSQAGWSLSANNGDQTEAVGLMRQGLRLLDRTSGLPWVPQGFVLTGPDGTAYSLDATGKVLGLRFSDGQQWLVSDAGVALVGATDPGQRIVFERDEQGRIERVVGPQAGGSDGSIVYRYDSAGRLILARSLYGIATLNEALGCSAGLPRPPAPITSTLAFLSRFWPVIPTSGMIRWRL